MEEDDKGCPMIRMGVSGWVFLLVPAYPGSPGPKAIKRWCVCVTIIAIIKWENAETATYDWLSLRCADAASAEHISVSVSPTCHHQQHDMAFQNNLCNTANDWLNWHVCWRHTNWTGVRQLDFYRSVHSATEWASNVLVLQHPINKSWTCRLTRSSCCGSGARLSNLLMKFLGKWPNLQRSQEKVTIMLIFKTTEEILRKKLRKTYETLRKVKKT